MPMHVEPVALRGQTVRLEPLAMTHVPALCEVGLDAELWRWVPSLISTPDEMRAYVEEALDQQRRGISAPFALVDLATEKVIGSTRYCAIEPMHRRLEIGWTWLAKTHQRTKANTEAKLLLLTHAFETLKANRVEIKTDALNEKSRNAIARLGATQEGIFREHMIVPRSGRLRATVYFSIVNGELPARKTKIIAMLEERR